jgi:hypothetical protein
MRLDVARRRKALRNVGLRLVIVVIRDEVLDGVLREERFELPIELGRQRLVMGENERRPPQGRDDRGDRDGFSGAGHAEQRVVPATRLETGHEFGNSLGLVTGRFERELEAEVGHGLLAVSC